MQYLLLIYDDESVTPPRHQAEPDYLKGFEDLASRLATAGKMKGGAALQNSSTATSVRVRNGDVLLTDGPFAETREQLGGFYLIDAENLDEALAVAAEIPAARFGTVEVRPIQVFERHG